MVAGGSAILVRGLTEGLDGRIIGAAMAEETVRVISYAGGRGEESPRSFYLDGARIEVEEVLRSWIGEKKEGKCRRRFFRVRGSDGAEHLLSCDERLGTWFLSRDDPRTS